MCVLPTEWTHTQSREYSDDGSVPVFKSILDASMLDFRSDAVTFRTTSCQPDAPGNYH